MQVTSFCCRKSRFHLLQLYTCRIVREHVLVKCVCEYHRGRVLREAIPCAPDKKSAILMAVSLLRWKEMLTSPLREATI